MTIEEQKYWYNRGARDALTTIRAKLAPMIQVTAGSPVADLLSSLGELIDCDIKAYSDLTAQQREKKN